MHPTLFIADLHLSDDTPELNLLFANFLHKHQDKAAALYILGDLFEAWTGDDDPSQTAAQVATQIRVFSQSAPVYFIAGNRDFMLGNDYAQKANMILLPENHLIDIAGKTILLTHGDEMCTDDVAYLRYRHIIRQVWVKKLLRTLPFCQRQRIAAKIRAQSRIRKQSGTDYTLTDVTEQGVQAALTHFPHVQIIVHGHTHRPNTHTHCFRQHCITRYVLPDWHDNQGGYLAIDDNGAHFFRLPENTESSI
ncbi:MAG: UDP-2,3-diacylglucosamine diphosphatase [Alysiella sp.]|uniref:UDP-2,3-diacylglucosamine diphosphatase n=1 Tax=Alysiella sp. TaxID=1872483 RepID=UPI0026DCEC6E|nr:UDP-2,3-diacylglucosamine diphosphatase [Alysiella sp.]MDO4434261.1 UDP-2,3-diacylglucosamine diphosphatase [Alysiella sp.]